MLSPWEKETELFSCSGGYIITLSELLQHIGEVNSEDREILECWLKEYPSHEDQCVWWAKRIVIAFRYRGLGGTTRGLVNDVLGLPNKKYQEKKD
jgi:hypothetical protein